MIEEVKKRVKEYKRGIHPEYNSPNQWGANGGADCIAFLDALEKAEAEVARLKAEFEGMIETLRTDNVKLRGELESANENILVEGAGLEAERNRIHKENLALAAQIKAMRETLNKIAENYPIETSCVWCSGAACTKDCPKTLARQALSTPSSVYEALVEAWREVANSAENILAALITSASLDHAHHLAPKFTDLRKALDAVRKAEKSL